MLASLGIGDESRRVDDHDDARDEVGDLESEYDDRGEAK